MKLLLDTNAYSGLMKVVDREGNHVSDEGKRKLVEYVRLAEKICMSAIVVGELIAGFRYGKLYEKNIWILEKFLAEPFVEFIPVSRESCDRFALIWNQLRKRGRPVPTNDIWIAAHVQQTGADFLTSDRHFDQIDGLPVIRFDL